MCFFDGPIGEFAGCYATKNGFWDDPSLIPYLDLATGHDAWNKFFFQQNLPNGSLMVICYGTISANDKLVVWVGGLGF